MKNVLALVLVALAGAALAARATYKPPVAVLPFKNLNADVSSDWLKLGVAETMISDLEKAKVPVVERDQIDKALGEILLRGGTATEDGQAIQVGKLVGAKTVVVGSFQAAGKKLRFNARFVEVETGVILDTAKATGPMANVFALQDQVVGKLLGKAPPARAKPKKAAKTVEAYRLYAMSLATASDADRVGLLKKSLSLDPDFVYAADELAALEKRLEEYAKERETASLSLDKSTFDLLVDPKVPAHEKQWRAGQLLVRHLGERRCKAAVFDAKRILDLGIPDPEAAVVGANENALNTLVLCYRILGQDDLAIQAAESLMKRFPAGAWFKTAERQVTEIVEWRKGAPERAAKIDARFAELAKMDEAARAKVASRNPAWLAGELRRTDSERCWFPRRLDCERTLETCRAFQEKYAKDAAAAVELRQAREYEIECLAELGRWDEAMPAARAFLAEKPEDGFTTNLRSMVEHHWPTDVGGP